MDKKHSRDLSTLKLQSLLGKREVVLYETPFLGKFKLTQLELTTPALPYVLIY